MGGFITPSARIKGVVTAPGIPLAVDTSTGLYQLNGGVGIAVNNQSFFELYSTMALMGYSLPLDFSLTATAGSPFATGTLPTAVSASVNGRVVCITNYSDNTISSYLRDIDTGILSVAPGSPYAVGSLPTDIVISPNGAFVFVSNYTGGVGASISAYTIDNLTGALTPVVGSPFNPGLWPNGLVVTPDNKYLIVAGRGIVGGGGVSVMAITPVTGTLTLVVGSPFPLGYPGDIPNGTWAALAPNSIDLYVSGGGPLISRYTVNQTTGVLTQALDSPYVLNTGVAITGHLTVSPDGRFLVVVQAGSPFYLHVFKINSDGSFNEIASSPFINTSANTNVKFSPTGDLLYVSHTFTVGATGGVAVYSVNISTGELTAIAGSPFLLGRSFSSVCVTGDNTHVLFTDYAGGLYSYRLSATTQAPLLKAVFDSSGGSGGSLMVNGTMNVNGSLLIAGATPATFPATAGQAGKFLHLNTAGAVEWTPLNKYIPVAMVANAGAFTVDTDSEYIVDVTGVLTAQGVVTYTATIVPLPTTVIFNNMTTGGFPLILNAGGFIIPPGKSTWYWDGATLKIVTQNTLRSQSLAMVANAGSLTLYDHCDNYVSVTGVLTANGQITTTFPANSTQVTFNNATTGAFLLQINAGAYTLPSGISTWIWDGAVFTSTSAVQFATSAENIAGVVENKAVDPLGIREAFNAGGTAPVFACRAWVTFEGTSGTPVIAASGNVTSITDNGVGDYTINFTAALPDANYVVSQSNHANAFALGGGVSLYNCVNITTKAAGSCRIQVYSYTGSTNTASAQDANVINLAFFR